MSISEFVLTAYKYTLSSTHLQITKQDHTDLQLVIVVTKAAPALFIKLNS